MPPISARIDRLPAVATVWRLVALLSIGGFFELYDLFQTAYISPGLISDGIFHTGSEGVFGFSDQAAFASATFLGLFLGASLLSPIADRFGRRAIFTFALIWYTVATVSMGFKLRRWALSACAFWWALAWDRAGDHRRLPLGTGAQTHAQFGVCLRVFRPVSVGAGGGVDVVVAGAAGAVRCVRLALGGVGECGVCAVHLVAAYALAGVTALAGAAWPVRRGRQIIDGMEARCVKDQGKPLDEPEPAAVDVQGTGRFADIWQPPYRRRALMLIVFHVFQAIGFFGFGNWLPALLSGQGVSVTHSLMYAFIITLAYPLGPLLFVKFANRFENKWQIVGSALGRDDLRHPVRPANHALGLMICGVMITFCNAWLSFSYHSYQSELFPTNIRARAVGFCYSFSRLSTVFSSLLIGIFLEHLGTPGVLAFIVSSMLIVMITISWFGPRTRNLALENIAHR